jgi:hypothetical protein
MSQYYSHTYVHHSASPQKKCTGTAFLEDIQVQTVHQKYTAVNEPLFIHTLLILQGFTTVRRKKKYIAFAEQNTPSSHR